mgnify:CR=1 FL=1
MIHHKELTEITKIISESGTEKVLVPANLLLGHNQYGKNLNAIYVDFLIDYYYENRQDRRNIRKRIDKQITKIKAFKSIDNKYIKIKKNILTEYYDNLPIMVEDYFSSFNKDLREIILGLLKTFTRIAIRESDPLSKYLVKKDK